MTAGKFPGTETHTKPHKKANKFITKAAKAANFSIEKFMDDGSICDDGVELAGIGV